MNDVIVMVADQGYINHAKSVMVNCRKQGGWTGDFSVISPQSCDTSDLSRRGIDVLAVPDTQWTFLTKFWAFTEHYWKWDRALCIDLDIMVQGSLQKVFDGLGPRLPKILCDIEDGTTIAALKQFDPQKDEHEAIYSTIEQRFPHVNKRMFNMAFLFYQPNSIPLYIMDRLLALHEEFKAVNPTNADQMLVNMLLYDRLEEAGKDYFCFFGHDYPGNRVASEFRKWRGDEVPSILHYCRWMAPWIVKQTCDSPVPNTEPGGYRNHRLSRICHELYFENLAAFEQTFPVLS